MIHKASFDDVLRYAPSAAAVLGRRHRRTAGGGGGVPPDVDDDFSTYSSTSDFASNPRGIIMTGEFLPQTPASNQWFLDNLIALMKTGGFGGSPNFLQYNFPIGPSCSDFSISCSYKMQSGFLGLLQSVYVEVWVAMSPGFLTINNAGTCGTDQGYKLLDVNVDPGDRFSIGFRTGDNPPSTGQIWFGYPNNQTDPAGKINWSDLSNPNLTDGNYHRYRIYCRISTGSPGAPNANGALKGWVDNDLVVNQTGLLTTSIAGNTPPVAFNFLSLARNMNQQPNFAQQVKWGRVRMWQNDPGWF